MGGSVITLAFVLALGEIGQTPESIKQEEIDYQNQTFQRWWATDLNWRFEDLPTKGSVPAHRVPYSGHDYPDKAGGTVQALRKYDLAFHGGRAKATAYEQEDVTAQKEWVTRRGGLLGFRRVRRFETPDWHGHCNGWTAASIRHAEPEKSVTRNGVVFTPADIKGLLADMYMYTDSEFLGGIDPAINPGTLHVTIANWLGLGSHPVGMESTLGEEAFNYPIYAFAATSADRADRKVEVKMNVAYAKSSNREFQESPRIKGVMYFHYLLQLNEDGDIVGGQYYGDSARIDMLWAPLQPVQGGEEGNKRGNPHLDIKEVLAIWRESVSEETRGKWYNIDPTEEDAIVEAEELEAVEEGQSEEVGGSTGSLSHG
jgi:hypothetical protein